MSEAHTVEEPTLDTGDNTPRRRWFQRQPVRALKREVFLGEEMRRRWDKRDNDETRLPESESVHLGGLVFVEAFTPSNVSALAKAIERWSSGDADTARALAANLARSRVRRRRGWDSLGVVRPPGTAVPSDGRYDPDLPDGVEAAWLHLHALTPALACVVAVFTIAEDAGDLSDLMRADYTSRSGKPQVVVEGRFGRVRARLPWARPRNYRVKRAFHEARNEKRRAINARITEFETACGNWFFAKYPGRFAAAPPTARPVVQMFLTTERAPYSDEHPWMRSVDLDRFRSVWRSSAPAGWWLASSELGCVARLRTTALAAKRADVALEQAGGESNWSLTQSFAIESGPLAAALAVPALLDIYAAAIGSLRDGASRRRRFSRPVRDARVLNDYLFREGLDVATVASGLGQFTRESDPFWFDFPALAEDRDSFEGATDDEPVSYADALRKSIREQAEHLVRDARVATENIRSSAELRQTIASTRLQRLVLLLTLCTVVVSILSLV